MTSQAGQASRLYKLQRAGHHSDLFNQLLLAGEEPSKQLSHSTHHVSGRRAQHSLVGVIGRWRTGHHHLRLLCLELSSRHKHKRLCSPWEAGDQGREPLAQLILRLSLFSLGLVIFHGLLGGVGKMCVVLQGLACAFVCEEAACMTWCVECTFVALCVYTPVRLGLSMYNSVPGCLSSKMYLCRGCSVLPQEPGPGSGTRESLCLPPGFRKE